MDPRSTVGRIYSRIFEEDHYTLLHTKYESFGSCGFREDFLKFFPRCLVVLEIFLCFTHDPPRGRGPYGPQGHSWQDKEDHDTLLHTRYESSGPCGFGEEYFFMFFP